MYALLWLLLACDRSPTPAAVEVVDWGRHEFNVYGTTGCAATKELVVKLDAKGIPYSLYFIDQDTFSKDQMQQKLNRPANAGKGFATPIVEIDGELLPMPDNINMDKIVARLGK